MSPGRKTSLSIDEARAQLLHESLLAHPEIVRSVKDIHGLPGVCWLHPEARLRAFDVLVDQGLVTEAADGVLCVHPRRRAA